MDLKPEQVNEMFKIEKKFWVEEVAEIKKYFDEYVNESTPTEIYKQINDLAARINQMSD